MNLKQLSYRVEQNTKALQEILCNLGLCEGIEHLKHSFVDVIPQELSENTIYISKETNKIVVTDDSGNIVWSKIYKSEPDLAVYDNSKEGYVKGVRSYNVSGQFTLTNDFYNAIITITGDTTINVDISNLVDNFVCHFYNKGENLVTFNVLDGNIYSPNGINITKNGFVFSYKDRSGELILTGDLE